MEQVDLDAWHMRRALELAERGQGHVEPNPMVGCVIARGAEIIGEGWHRRFGEAHAELEALRVAGARAAEATMYVTLEPCCHHGKTPPCADAVIKAGLRRVVVAQRDPFPQVNGGGLQRLHDAGLDVEVGLLEAEAAGLNAPYLKLIRTGRPWIIGKWAMTLDGKIATASGHSRWISCEQSRQIVHSLRARVDAVMVGRRTAELDDPLLTARPPGPRTAARVVVDSSATLSPDSQLVQTARRWPTIIAVAGNVAAESRRQLEAAGCEVLAGGGETPGSRLEALLEEFGRRRWTNVLVEGGGRLLGSLFDAGQLDEVHVFLAPKLIGGATAPSPVGGAGIERMTEALRMNTVRVQTVGDDVYLSGRR